jgi:hypothetical protein
MQVDKLTVSSIIETEHGEEYWDDMGDKQLDEQLV